ncbi:MAG: hypothetical protein GAK35_04178 [Herbaspirillum frisingense]|uniref:Uncharacterized protein n=1 Tax=Herbaspirillum frisingense TaxID=92645 RepID=A0A7V8FSW0_9BURK|nr:MAG: hypothetical protein GAK35_04178 [Herbaspirillum frisingense]
MLGAQSKAPCAEGALRGLGCCRSGGADRLRAEERAYFMAEAGRRPRT